MKVSDADRQRMRRLGEVLQTIETDDEPSIEVRAARIAAANEWRQAHGIAPLVEESETDPPELEFYRRARALGLSRRSR